MISANLRIPPRAIFTLDLIVGVDNRRRQLDRSGTVDTQANTLTMSGVISDAGSLTKLGSGTLVLTGDNTYGGGTLLDAGTLNVSSDQNLGAASGTLTMNGAPAVRLQAGASFTIARDILLRNASIFDTNGFNLTLSSVIAPVLANVGTLDKAGNGTLTLTNPDNTYNGGTEIDVGTLALAGTGTLGNSGITMQSGAALDISQSSVGASTIFLDGAGSVFLGNQTFTLGGNTVSTFAGTIADGGIAGGTGGKVVIQGNGGGSVTFTGINTYTGGTTINGTIGGSGAGYSLKLSGAGALAPTGAVAVNSDGNFDISGLTTVGTTIGDLSGVGLVSLGAESLTLGTANDSTFSGVIYGAGGSLVKQGSGTFVLDNSNAYTGDTTVQAGTLIVGDTAGDGAALADNVNVDSDATLGGNGRRLHR